MDVVLNQVTLLPSQQDYIFMSSQDQEKWRLSLTVGACSFLVNHASQVDYPPPLADSGMGSDI